MRSVYKPSRSPKYAWDVESQNSTDERVKWSRQARYLDRKVPMARDSITISAGPRLRTALFLAIIADVVQFVVLPLVVTGAASPADDILDISVAVILSLLIGWHWEFLPSFLAELIPGVDLLPCWTIAVAIVYRRSKQAAVSMEGVQEDKRAQHT